jgi:hypothetical protein
MDPRRPSSSAPTGHIPAVPAPCGGKPGAVQPKTATAPRMPAVPAPCGGNVGSAQAKMVAGGRAPRMPAVPAPCGGNVGHVQAKMAAGPHAPRMPALPAPCGGNVGHVQAKMAAGPRAPLRAQRAGRVVQPFRRLAGGGIVLEQADIPDYKDEGLKARYEAELVELNLVYKQQSASMAAALNDADAARLKETCEDTRAAILVRKNQLNMIKYQTLINVPANTALFINLDPGGAREGCEIAALARGVRPMPLELVADASDTKDAKAPGKYKVGGAPANGDYHFAIRASDRTKVYVALELGHALNADDEPVVFAGTATFAQGALTMWNTNTGHYRTIGAHKDQVRDAKSATGAPLLPEDKYQNYNPGPDMKAIAAALNTAPAAAAGSAAAAAGSAAAAAPNAAQVAVLRAQVAKLRKSGATAQIAALLAKLKAMGVTE